MIVTRANMWGVTRKRTQSYRIKTVMIIMTRLFANIPGICCVTFRYPFFYFFVSIILLTDFFNRSLHTTMRHA